MGAFLQNQFLKRRMISSKSRSLFAAAFFGLILRVLKNVFARAVTLQEEADYTI